LKDFSPSIAKFGVRFDKFAQITDMALHGKVEKGRKFTSLSQWHLVCLMF
jgi:hypothetical protein